MKPLPRHLRTAGWLAVGQVGAQVATAAALLLVARSLGVESFGVFAQFYACTLFASVLLDRGASSRWVKQLSRDKTYADFACIARFRSHDTATGMLILTVSYVLLPQAAPYLSVVVGGAALANGRIYSALLKDLDLVWRSTLVLTIERTALIGLVILLELGVSKPNVASFSVTVVLAFVVGAAMMKFLWPREFRALPKSGPLGRRDAYRGGGHLGTAALAVSLQGLDSVLIGIVANNSVVGTYAAVARWTQPIGLFAQSLSQGAYISLVGTSSAIKPRSVVLSCWAVMTPAILAAVGVALFSEVLVEMLLGSAYLGSAGALSLLSLGAVLSMLAAPLTALLQARGQEAAVALALAVGTAVQFAGVIVFVPSALATGAALAQVSAQVVILVLVGVATYRGGRMRV